MSDETTEAGEASVVDCVRARRFELVGSDGAVKAVLGEIEKHPLDDEFVAGGNYGLAILDDQGRPQIRIVGRRADHLLTMQGIVLYDDEGRTRVVLHTGVGLAGVSVEPRSGVSILLGSQVGGPGHLRIVKQEGFKSLVLVQPEGIEIRDEAGEMQFQAPS